MQIGTIEENIIFEIVRLKLEVASPFQAYFNRLLEIKNSHPQLKPDHFLYLSEISKIVFDFLPKLNETPTSANSLRKKLKSVNIDLSELFIQAIWDLNLKSIKNFIINRWPFDPIHHTLPWYPFKLEPSHCPKLWPTSQEIQFISTSKDFVLT